MNKKGIAAVIVGVSLLCALGLIGMVGAVRKAADRRAAREAAEARWAEGRFLLRDELDAPPREEFDTTETERLIGAELDKDRPAERAAARDSETAPLPPDHPDAAEFAPLFVGLGRALVANDRDGVNVFCDQERLLREVVRFGGGRGWPGGPDEFRAAFQRDNPRWLADQLFPDQPFDWDSLRVCNVYWARERREAVLITHHRDTDDQLQRTRWWVVRGPDGWSVYDQTSVSAPSRSAAHLGFDFAPEVLAHRDAHPGVILDASEALVEACKGGPPVPPERLEQLLGRTRGVPMSRPARANRAIVEARIHIARGDLNAALDRLDESAQLNPDSWSALTWRLSVLNGLGRFEDVLAAVRVAQNEFGPTAATRTYEGFALEQLGRRGEAAAAYRVALDNARADAEALNGLRRVLPAGEKGELATRFAHVRDPHKLYYGTIHLARQDNDTAAEAALLDGFLKARPDDPFPLGEDIRRKVKAGTFADAAKVLTRGLKLKGEGDLDTVLTAYLFAMMRADKVLDGYAAVPAEHARRAFRTLADELEDELFDDDGKEPPQLKQLRDLIAAHRTRSDGDPWLAYFAGTIHRHAKEYALAEKAFAEGAAKLEPRKPDPDDGPNARDWDADRFRSRRVDCLFRLKKGLEAYKTVGPADDTFRELARMYDTDKDTAGLDKLILAHQVADTGDTELTYWRGRLLFLRGEYGRAVLVHEKYLEKSEANAPSRWLARNELVRARLRVNPTGAAESLAELGPESVNLPLRAAVAAATGDRAELERLLEESTKHGGKTWFYSDEDFRQFIGQEKYRDLRAKYPDPNPPPKQNG